MGKDVLVTIKSTKKDSDNDTEVIELVSPGTFHKKGNSYYILYPETVISGTENSTTSVKVAADTVTIVRSGHINMRQVFEKGKLHRSVYQTPFGSMNMTVLPLQIEVDLTDLGGSIKLEYELTLNDNKLGTNTLEIKVRPK
ncbi:DUF1934 domain-containing protein [Desulfotomaculum nigrificans]|uniref:DUF1934 domain-containing protein n=1 Tax=Desulfotomaculum nigrificans TaxID=1565 RepID=UPI0001FAE486|nr:DUF1934 domain-containing protein [Desulfotomaculum nigrificans]